MALSGALGASPADKRINFEPNASVELSFNIINSEGSAFNASLNANGELKDIIFLEKDTVPVYADAFRTPFKVTIKFPSSMEPGLRVGGIRITPIFNPGAGPNAVYAYVSPQIPIYVKVPYSSKYADVYLEVMSVDEGTPIPVFVNFDNIGSEDILAAKAEVEIFGNSQKSLGTFKTTQVSVKKNTMEGAQLQGLPLLKNGMYSANIKATYDELNKTFQTNFTLGSPLVKIKELVTRKLLPGQVNRIVFKAQNEWDSELSVSGFVAINDNKNEMPTFRLKAGEERSITGYIDTTGLTVGEYNMSITLAYDDVMKAQTFLVAISEQEAKPTTVPANRFFLISLIALVILIIIAVMILLRKRREIKNRE